MGIHIQLSAQIFYGVLQLNDGGGETLILPYHFLVLSEDLRVCFKHDIEQKGK